MQRNRYHHLSWLNGIELFEAAFSTQTFARHAHEGFAIGAIADGVGGYLCRGESMLLPAGSLSLMNPEEPHTGHAAAGRVRYSMLYASEVAVREMLDVRDLQGFSDVTPPDLNRGLTGALASLAARLNSKEPLGDNGSYDRIGQIECSDLHTLFLPPPPLRSPIGALGKLEEGERRGDSG